MESSQIPHLEETLADDIITNIYIGGHFVIALGKTGLLYSWGKGSKYRLGHGSEDDVGCPKLIEALMGMLFYRN